MYFQMRLPVRELMRLFFVDAETELPQYMRVRHANCCQQVEEHLPTFPIVPAPFKDASFLQSSHSCQHIPLDGKDHVLSCLHMLKKVLFHDHFSPVVILVCETRIELVFTQVIEHAAEDLL